MPGEYRISVDFSGARERMRQADLAPWSGTFANSSSLSLIVQEARSEGERWIAFQLTSRQALGHSDWTGALAQFQQMVAIDPTSQEAHAGMGSALLQLGRFAEAAMELEQALPEDREESVVPQDLALAYVAMGFRDRADTLLRRYYQPSRLPGILADILERAERLPTQP
jgi:predicted Zn-dependent protease